MARPVKPTAVKKLQGTQKKCRENKNEPKFTELDKLPPCPKEFGEYGKYLWTFGNELIKNKIANSVDINISFEMLCATYNRYKTLRNHIEKNLLVNISGLNGGRSAAAQQMNADEKTLIKMFNEFGFTPASRAKLGVGKTKETDPDTEKMRSLIGA